LFWTIPVPPSAIAFDATTGEARFRASDVRLKDFHDIINAITGSPRKPVPSHVSFDVHWHGHGERRTVHDKTFGFQGNYITGPATISFTASQDGKGVVYRSDPGHQHNPTIKQNGAGPPAIGHERNGRFFS
jgi:hypothetical protein